MKDTHPRWVSFAAGPALWWLVRILAMVVPPVVRYLVDRLDKEREDADLELEDTDPGGPRSLHVPVDHFQLYDDPTPPEVRRRRFALDEDDDDNVA